MELQQFKQAMDVLLSPSFQTASQHQAANLWLHNFATTPQAWEAALAVLHEPSTPSSHAFFTANLLLSKTRTEWGRPNLSQEQRAHISGATSACLQLPLNALAHERVILVMACIAAKEGAASVDSFCASALALAAAAQSPDQLRSALVMLKEVRSETSGLDTARVRVATQAMARHLQGLLALLQQVITNAAAAGGHLVLLAATRCLHAWSDKMGLPSTEDHVSPPQLPTPLPALYSGGYESVAVSRPSAANITLQQLRADYPALFSTVFQLVADPHTPDDVRQECAQACVALLDGAPEDVVAVADAAAALSAQMPHVSDPSNEAGAASVAAVATAISDGAADFAAGAPPPSIPEGPAKEAAIQVALQLAQLMLACVSRPERAVTDAALDYFININTVPVASRAEPLQSGLYAQALPSLVPKAAYPSDFASWEEAEEDEDSFRRFRDHQLSEVLECCCAMLGPRSYLSLLASAAAAAANGTPEEWRTYEASLFCVRAVSMPLKVFILGKDRGSLISEARTIQQMTDASFASAALSSIFTSVAGPVAHMHNPWVLKEACRLIGEFTAWLDLNRNGLREGLPAEAARLGAHEAQASLQAAPPPPLQAVLAVLIRGLSTSTAASNAAQALCNVCVRCGKALCAPEMLQGLMDGVLRIVAPPPDQPHPPFFPDIAERQIVIEGLSRVVAALPSPSGPQGPPAPHGLTMADGAVALVVPLLDRARAAAQAGTSVQPQALKTLSEDLRLLASALRFMDVASRGSLPTPAHAQPSLNHPAMKVLQVAWPVLESVAAHPACQKEPEVVAAVCEVYQRALVSTRSSGHALLPPLLSTTTTLFSTSHHPSCCDVLGTVAEVFGEVRVVEVAITQAGVVAGIISATHTLLQGGAAAREYGDLLRALFQMADRYLVFARDVLLDVPSLPQLVALAPHTIRLREREPVLGVLVFLGRVFGTAGKVSTLEQKPQVDRLTSCLVAEGPQVMTALLLAVADGISRQLSRPLAGTLWAVLQCEALGGAGREWLVAAMQGPEFAGACMNMLPAEEASRFCAALVRAPLLPRGRFDALVGDLAAVLRGEAASDVVLAYEM